MRLLSFLSLLLLYATLPATAPAGVPTPARVITTSPAVRPVPFLPADVDDLPDPLRSICRVTGNSLPCQFRFRQDGGLDRLTLFVTLRDAFDVPVANCSTSARLEPVGAKISEGCWVGEPGAALGSCDGQLRSGVTDSAGAVEYVWDRVGGRGVAAIAITQHCGGSAQICRPEFVYTSSDLNADGTLDIQDIGLFSFCFGTQPVCQSSDTNCDCVVDILDIGVFSGGFWLPSCP